MKEQPRHIKAFEYYVSLDKRSYKEVAIKYKVSDCAVAKWSKAFNWQERLAERIPERECGKTSQIPIPKAKITADHFDKLVRLVIHLLGEEEL